jgi:nucleoside-diphosphate-sugar epimerase
MRILVTGATGFIGTRLCQLLIQQGHAVTGLSRRGSGTVAGVDYRAKDFIDTPSLQGCVEGVDCIVHLAGRAHVMDPRTDAPELYREVNHEATVRLARLALEAGVKRFVFISTIRVNGNASDQQRFTEASVPNPVVAYDRSKLDAENGLRALLDGTSTELVIIRPPLVYGVNALGNFRTLLKVVEKGLPSPLSQVRNARSLISVDNLASLIVLAIQHPDAAGQLFLASDGSDVSTHQILVALAEGMQKRLWSVPVPPSLLAFLFKLIGKEDTHTKLCGSLTVDSSKARDVLGYRPANDTLASLAQVGRQCRANRKNPR